MRNALFATMVFLMVVGPSWAKDYVVTGKAGGYTVKAIFDKTRPVLGANRLEIAVTDAASRPMTDAQVDIDYFMPSLPGRPPMMDYNITAKPLGDRYEATLKLTMKGEWKVAVSVTRSNKTEKMTFGFDVR
jgi:hypothetical protein